MRRLSLDVTFTSVDWSFTLYSELITGSATMCSSMGNSRLDIGMSTVPRTFASMTMRPCEKETSTGSRSHL